MFSTRASRLPFLCLGVAVAVVGSQAILGQAPTPSPQPSPSAPPNAVSFSSEVEQVLVDVVATDKKGVSIKDLTQADFSVNEDGKPQSIVSFEAVEFKDAPAPAPGTRVAVSSNVGIGAGTASRTGRSFIIVFDDVHLTMFEARQAKLAIAEFLQHATHESDHVTIVATGGAAWWSARADAAGRTELVSILKRIDGRLILDNAPDSMSDFEAMRIHTFGDTEVMSRVQRRFESRGMQTQNTASGQNQQSQGGAQMDDPMVQGRATEVYFQALSRNRLTLEMVERMLRAMEGVQGRKSVVLVSRGFIYDPNMDEFKRVTQASRRSNAAVYFLNAKGLEGMATGMSAEFGGAIAPQDIGAAFAETFEATEGADSIAVDSGGFVVRNTNDLTKGLKRIADDSRSYYLLGYNSTNAKRDGRFRKIQVKVERKGVELRARKGYYARLEGADPLAAKKKAPGGPDQALQAALDSPFESAAVPLRMEAIVGEETLLGKAQTMVVADIDVDHFALELKDGRWSGMLEFLLVVAHRETGEFLRYDQQVDMRLLPATRDRLRSQWFQLSRDFELAPGGYQAKLVVRDKNSAAVGTLMHNFEVPALEPWRMSSPVLTDVLQPDPPGQPSKVPRLMPVARRTFPVGATLWCSYDVYGAVKDKATGMPKVTADYVLRRSDGTEAARMPPTPIKPTSLGHLSRLTGTSLEKVEPGDYQFVISLKDELSGETMEVAEPLTVVTASPATAQAKTN